MALKNIRVGDVIVRGEYKWGRVDSIEIVDSAIHLDISWLDGYDEDVELDRKPEFFTQHIKLTASEQRVLRKAYSREEQQFKMELLKI